MSDAQAEIARLTALVESLRREVREQRREIAGLREERRALLEADRPQPDRPEAIKRDESDRPEPIADARLAALQQLAELDEELGLACTPNPHATPAECTVPPEWTSRPYWVDPPSGWRYGFPRLYDPATDGDMRAWMIAMGYPRRLAEQGLPCTFTACTDAEEAQRMLAMRDGVSRATTVGK